MEDMKSMKINNYLPGLVLALLAACDNAPVPEQAVTAEGGFTDVAGVTLERGKPAPDFSLQALKGQAVRATGQ